MPVRREEGRAATASPAMSASRPTKSSLARARKVSSPVSRSKAMNVGVKHILREEGGQTTVNEDAKNAVTQETQSTHTMRREIEMCSVWIVDDIVKSKGKHVSLIRQEVQAAVEKGAVSLPDGVTKVFRTLRWLPKGGLMIEFTSVDMMHVMEKHNFKQVLRDWFGAKITVHPPRSVTNRSHRQQDGALTNYAGAICVRNVSVHLKIDEINNFIEVDNEGLRGTVEAIRLSRWNSEKKIRESLSTLKVLVESPDDLERLVKNGLVIGYDNYRVVEWKEKEKVVQCYTCLKFGHRSKNCKSETKEKVCARCAQPGHMSDQCSTAAVQCANCQGAHVAWSKECPKRIDIVDKLCQKKKEGQKLRSNDLEQALHDCWEGPDSNPTAMLDTLKRFVQFAEAQLSQLRKQDEVREVKQFSFTVCDPFSS